LRSGLRLCGRRRTRLARSARGALARGAVHPGARPDRRAAGLRGHAQAAEVALRCRHRLELPGAEPETVKAFQGIGTAPLLWSSLRGDATLAIMRAVARPRSAGRRYCRTTSTSIACRGPAIYWRRFMKGG